MEERNSSTFPTFPESNLHVLTCAHTRLVPSSMANGPNTSTRKFRPEKTSALSSYSYTCSLERILPFPF